MAPLSLFGNLRKAMQIKQLILLLGASMLSIASFAQEKKGVESPILSLQQKAAIALPHSFGLTDTTAQTATEPLLNASALAPTPSAVLHQSRCQGMVCPKRGKTQSTYTPDLYSTALLYEFL